MSFFGKVKKFFGAGAPVVELVGVNPEPYKKDYVLSGAIRLKAKDACRVKSLRAVFVEETETGRGNERQVETKKIAQTEHFAAAGQEGLVGYPLEVGAESEQVFNFNLTGISLQKPLSAEGGALGTIGKLGAFATNEKRSYKLEIEANVEGVALSPSAKKDIAVDFSTWA
jgi:hypothetical protein